MSLTTPTPALPAARDVHTHSAARAALVTGAMGGARTAAQAPRLAPRLWLAGGLLVLAGASGAAYFAGRHAAPAAQAESAVTTPAARTAPAPAEARMATSPSEPAAPVCADCGVVTAVQAIQKKGEGSGVGAVAGGVVGGALGNQVGKGKGRTAMTVLGAIGGGLAGHEVEKRVRATTVYQVQVRTEAGQMRSFELAQAPQVGQKVRIDGKQLHLVTPAQAGRS